MWNHGLEMFVLCFWAFKRHDKLNDDFFLPAWGVAQESHVDIYVCIRVCVYIYIYISIYLSIHPSIHPSIHTYIHTYICTNTGLRALFDRRGRTDGAGPSTTTVSFHNFKSHNNNSNNNSNNNDTNNDNDELPRWKNKRYGQFSKCHVCFCGLDPGNLKFESTDK